MININLYTYITSIKIEIFNTHKALVNLTNSNGNMFH